MRVTTLARLVRIPAVFAVVLPVFAAACANDPMAPRESAQASRASVSAASSDSVSAGTGANPNGQGGGVQPWY